MKLKLLFYVSLIPQVVALALVEVFGVVSEDEINAFLNAPPQLLKVPFVFVVAGSGIIFYLYMLSDSYKNKRWIHFFLVLLTVVYMWIYYLLFIRESKEATSPPSYL